MNPASEWNRVLFEVAGDVAHLEKELGWEVVALCQADKDVAEMSRPTLIRRAALAIMAAATMEVTDGVG